MANDLAVIHNLSDLNTWVGGAAHAKVKFSWTFSDPDGGAQGAFQVRVYNDSGGSPGSLNHTSGKITSTANFWEDTTALADATVFHWSIELWDDMDESGGESSKTSFKIRYGQAIYEFNVGASASWNFSAASVPANTSKALLFRTATGANGAGASAWKTSIGDLVPGTWLNVLVRLSTSVSGTQPTFSDMTFFYTGSASSPDHWTTVGGTWTLDDSNFRYGSRSFKCVVPDNATSPEIYPWRFVAGDDTVVQPETDYMFSKFVRTDPTNPFGAGSSLRLYIGDGSGTALAVGAVGQSYGDGATSDSSASPEGWQRLVLRYKTAVGETLVRPKLQYINGGAGSGDTFWVDAAKFEPGTVASPWAPGWVGSAIVLDSYGIDIDGSGGATFRIRHTNGVDEVDGDEIVDAVSGGGGGAPTTVNYLVGTADAGLSAEIVVGTTPGGELGGTWASPTVDGTHSGSAHTDFIAKTVANAKGDIFTATANDTPAILTAGADYTVLNARAGATNGIEWGQRFHSIVLTADQTRTANTNTLADVPGLTLALPSSLTVLWFEWVGYYQSNTATCGILCSVNAGGGTANHVSRVMTASTPTYVEGNRVALDGGTATTSVDTINTNRYFEVKGQILSPTGTLAMRYANEVAVAGNSVKIMTGSVLRVWMV